MEPIGHDGRCLTHGLRGSMIRECVGHERQLHEDDSKAPETRCRIMPKRPSVDDSCKDEQEPDSEHPEVAIVGITQDHPGSGTD
jgi:hypothetical protein